MAKKRIQPNDEEIARRAMNLARQVGGRLFVSRDGVYLVSGIPNFRKLLHCLAGLRRPPECDHAPTPMELGFAPSQIAPLTSERLATWGRGLQKWRKILNDYEKPRQKTAERRHRYRRWKDEIAHLSHTLEQLWQVLRQWDGGKPIPGAPYVSEHAAANAVDGAKIQFAEPLWAWLEWLVVWIAGPSAGRRFHKSLNPFVESRTTCKNRDILVRALRHLQLLQGRRKRPPKPEMAAAIRDALAGISEELLADFGLRLPQHPSEFQIDRVILALERAAETRLLPPPALVGSAAALCATDGVPVLMPPWLLSPCDAEAIDARSRVFIGLFEERGKTGYEKLLQALSEMRNVSGSDLPAIHQFLAAGVEVGDIEWALRALSGGAWELAGKGLSPRPFRTLVSVLERTGLKIRDMRLDDTNLNEVVWKVAKRGSANIVEAFALWLSSLSPSALNANLAKWAWNCLCQLLILEGASPALRDVLRRWADPPVSGEHDDPLTAAASPETRAWLSRLTYYQRLCGQQPALPGSVAIMLNPDEREARELEYLRKVRSRGELSDGMAARLALLESRDSDVRVTSGQRILKQAQEVCAHTALEAVRHLATREGRRVWGHLFGCEPLKHLSDDEVTAIAAWATGLDKTAIKCLRELLAAWRESGADYRGRLSFNASWTKAAVDRADLHAWFAPDPLEVAVEGLPVRICIAPDPFRVLLMGTYFGTCLSLDDFNKDSVLANAYDANKAVVFVLDSEGHVLARKLVCVSSGFHFIGYRTYIAVDESLTKARREGIASLVDAFCGRWARCAGLPLGFAGAPAKLSGLFWYDDGVTRWSPSAMRAWADPALDAGLIATAKGGLMPPVAAALDVRRDRCLGILSELGIWPPADGEALDDLADAPGLAEESLAVLARAKGDRELARLVFENAATPGGQLEAMTSVALLEKSDEMAEHVFSAARRGPDLADRAMEILRGVGSKKAWQLFMKLAVQEESAHPLWLPLAAADSDDSANALFEALLTPGPCKVGCYHLLLANEILSVHGRSLPQAAVIKALLSDYNGPVGRCSLAQWMPACPDALKRSRIERIARTDDSWDDEDQYASMAAVIVAMRNPGPRSTAYLRGRSQKDPSALLALSLQSGSKYREFIRKAALAAPAEPAAILALFVSEGDDVATTLLAPTVGKFPNQEERLNYARELHAAFHDLDNGRPVSCIAKSSRPGETLSTLPFVLHWLWKWTDTEQPNIAAIAALMDSSNHMDLLRAHGVYRCGLAVGMAKMLREASGKHKASMRKLLLALLDDDVTTRSNGYPFLLDRLADYRLFTEPSPKGHSPLGVTDILSCSGIWDLLLEKDGRERCSLKLVEYNSLWSCTFPADPRLAARVARLLPSFGPAKELIEDIRPMTEIQKQLMARYIQPKGG